MRSARTLGTLRALLIVRPVVILVAVTALIYRADCAFLTDTCKATNLFSYFTIHAVILFVIVLGAAAGFQLVKRQEPRFLTTLRVLVSAYMMVSGMTFALLMVHAAVINTVFLVPMSSKILHFVLPVYALVDVLLAPGHRPLLGKMVWASLVFPLIWGIYTLIRGALLGWYPYFFLNPANAGYDLVAVSALTLTGLILGTSAVVWALHRSRLKRLNHQGRGPYQKDPQ